MQVVTMEDWIMCACALLLISAVVIALEVS